MPWPCALTLLYVVPSGLLSWGLGTCSCQWLPWQDAGHQQVSRGPCLPVSAAWASSQHRGWIPRASVHRGPDRSTRHFMTLSQESQHVTSAIGTFNWLKLSQRPARFSMGKNDFHFLMGVGKVKILKASIRPCGLENIVVATFGKIQSDTHANRDRMHSNSSLRG